MSIYFNNIWKPVKNTIIKNEEWREKIHDLGYIKSDVINPETISALQELYDHTHKFSVKDGGMFYSVYSQNLEYRKKVHNEIGSILQPILDEYFQEYKVMINSFVVKLSGPESEFSLHQDTTGLDEWKYSPLNLWIPLQDVDENNGCLCLLPKSHRFFSPYRSIAFPAPYDQIPKKAKEYLDPIPMKAGEALVFDNRLLHHSYKNISGKTRVAVICGLFPKEAPLVTCHKPEYKFGGNVELIQHTDDFLLTYPKFLFDCQDRPNVGRSIKWVEDPFTEMTETEFDELCNMNGVFKTGHNGLEAKKHHLVSEPVQELAETKPKSVFSKIIAAFPFGQKH